MNDEQLAATVKAELARIASNVSAGLDANKTRTAELQARLLELVGHERGLAVIQSEVVWVWLPHADRSGDGNGRTYSLSATVSDLAGNTATATANCTVPHDQRK